MARVSTTMPAVLDPKRTLQRRRLTERAQKELNEWYTLNGKQPWEYEHPDGKTPTTIGEKP